MKATHKMVNGVRIELEHDEIKALEAEWQLNEPKPVKTDEELLAAYDALPAKQKEDLTAGILRELVLRRLRDNHV